MKKANKKVRLDDNLDIKPKPLNFYKELREAVNKRVFEYNEDILRKKQREEEQKKDQQVTIEQLRNRIKLLSQAQEA